jgi:hypothetical protein
MLEEMVFYVILGKYRAISNSTTDEKFQSTLHPSGQIRVVPWAKTIFKIQRYRLHQFPDADSLRNEKQKL